jgi:hypothetical protein
MLHQEEMSIEQLMLLELEIANQEEALVILEIRSKIVLEPEVLQVLELSNQEEALVILEIRIKIALEQELLPQEILVQILEVIQ